MDALAFSEERTLGELLLPGDKQFGALVVKSYNRDPGPQSIDLYYDWTDPLRPSLIEQQVTVRERIRTSKFMTWSSDESDARPLNLELPFADLGGGLTARLEFNWIDDLNSSVEDSLQPDSPSRIFNPFYHVWQHLGLVAGELSPLIEHTTTRKKFGVSEPNGKQVFAINIDFVAARKISKNQTASAVDVDISGVHPIDEMEWARLHAFATRLSFAFELKPNLRTKASKDQFLFNG